MRKLFTVRVKDENGQDSHLLNWPPCGFCLLWCAVVCTDSAQHSAWQQSAQETAVYALPCRRAKAVGWKRNTKHVNKWSQLRSQLDRKYCFMICANIVQKQCSYRLLGVVTRLVVVSNLYSRSRRAAFWPAISVLHLHFSQQSQYAVGDVLLSLVNTTKGLFRIISNEVPVLLRESPTKKSNFKLCLKALQLSKVGIWMHLTYPILSGQCFVCILERVTNFYQLSALQCI